MTVSTGAVRAGLVVLCCLGLAAFAGRAAAADEHEVTVHYQGTIDSTRSIVSPGDFKLHVEWELVWDVHPPLAGPAWRIVKLDGALSAVIPPPNESASCAGTLSDSTKLPWLSGQYKPEYVAHDRTVQVTAFAPIVLHSSSPHTPFGFCGNDEGETTVGGPPQPIPDPLQPRIDYVPGSGTVSKPFTQDWTDPNDPSHRFVLASTLTVNGTAPPLPKTPPAVRSAAVGALRQELGVALYPCLTAATGVVVFVAAGPAVGPMVGATMVAVAAPACARALSLLNNLQRVYRDPPEPRYELAATVTRRPAATVRFTPCTGSASVKRACSQLHAAALAWVVALQRVDESSSALATTIGREASARTAGDAAALALQQQTALDLLPTLRADLRRQTSAGRALAARLRTLGVTARLTKPQSATAIARVTSRLAARGTPAATLRAEAPAALTPRVVDLLAVLGARVG